MYHPQSTEQARARQKSRLRVLLAVAVAVVAAVVFFFFATSAMREQGALSLRMSILDAAKQCCAVEGSYPRSLGYLLDHYGLVVNERDYIVTYECFADNVLPSVTVVPR